MHENRRDLLRESLQTRLRTARATRADRGGREPEPATDSSGFQPLESGLGKPIQRRQPGAQNAKPILGDPIRSPAIFGAQGLDPPLLLEPGNRAVERAGTEARTAELLDVLDHRVAVFRSVGQAGKHQQRRVGVVAKLGDVLAFYYAARTTHDVVIAQEEPSRKQIIGPAL